MPFIAKKERKISVNHQNKLKNAFVLGQFVLSISLTIFCLVILMQINYINNFNVGYEKDNIVKVNMNGGTDKNFQAMKNTLLKLNVDEIKDCGKVLFWRDPNRLIAIEASI